MEKDQSNARKETEEMTIFPNKARKMAIYRKKEQKMTERERLIELIANAPKIDIPFGSRAQGKTYQTIQNIADYLLAKGGLFPPCKVGDDLFYPWVYGGTSGIAILEADSIKVYVDGRSLVFIKNPESDMPMPSYFCEEDFGKTVFLSREEAEKAIAERSKE